LLSNNNYFCKQEYFLTSLSLFVLTYNECELNIKYFTSRPLITFIIPFIRLNGVPGHFSKGVDNMCTEVWIDTLCCEIIRIRSILSPVCVVTYSLSDQWSTGKIFYIKFTLPLWYIYCIVYWFNHNDWFMPHSTILNHFHGLRTFKTRGKAVCFKCS
jgi:hypothetical protein